MDTSPWTACELDDTAFPGDCAPQSAKRSSVIADRTSPDGADFDFYVYAPRDALEPRPPPHFRGLSSRTAAASGLLLDFDGTEALPADPAARQQLGYVPWFGLGLQQSAAGSEWGAAMDRKLYDAQTDLDSNQGHSPGVHRSPAQQGKEVL